MLAGMIKLYLGTYAVIVTALWWCCPLIPDGILHDSYSYARMALHVIGPIWLAQQGRKQTLRGLAIGLGVDLGNHRSEHAIQGRRPILP
jgi:hypothetical protein